MSSTQQTIATRAIDTGGGRAPRVLILVENLPVPFDRRVWQECRALTAAGYDVSVVCPRTKQYPAAEETLEGIRILRYRPVLEARSAAAYLIEYAVAILSMLWLALKVRRDGQLDVIQACNPPDLLFLVAVPFVLGGHTAFVFDHHDVSPELLEAKGHSPDSWFVKVSRLLERITFRLASVSIATNESYQRVAFERGGKRREDVFVVRSGPDLTRFTGGSVRPELRGGARRLIAYVGVMGIQEGLDYLLDAAALLIADGQDLHFTLAGDGPERPRLLQRIEELGLQEHVDMPGRISDQHLLDLLATADVCVNPDTANPMNDMSTMNKVLEYMAAGKPIVQFDLREGRFSAQGASLYARPNDAQALAAALAQLLDDPDLGARMGKTGRARLESVLAWDQQVPVLLEAYSRAIELGSVVGRRRRRSNVVSWPR